MLPLTISAGELYDEVRNEFIVVDKDTELMLEHSLISISKWESKYHKPFIGKANKTNEELIYYIQCMTLNKNVNENVYKHITVEQLKAVKDYIDDPMTATKVTERGSRRKSNEIVTSEVIYGWMVALQIPYQFEKWHLNRLITLIKVCNAQNTPKKKMSMKDTVSQNASLNELRKARMGTKG